MRKRSGRRDYKHRIISICMIVLATFVAVIFVRKIIHDGKTSAAAVVADEGESYTAEVSENYKHDGTDDNSNNDNNNEDNKGDNYESKYESTELGSNNEKGSIGSGNDKGTYNEITDNDKYKEDYNIKEYMLNVPCICQKNDYPTGCESVSAVMALKYCGIDISVDEFIDKYLEMGEFYWDKDGVMHGDHPAEKFIGNPREIMAFGCYGPVIDNAVKKVLSDKDKDRELSVKSATGMELYKLCKKYIDNDIPVVIWASMGMKPTRDGRTWVLNNGDKFTWIAGEHCLVMTGYDEEYYYFNDPLAGKDIAYKKDVVELRYKELGSQSLVIE